MNAQEQFWKGEFGSEYTRRNRVMWERRIPFWRQILDVTQARSVLDVGCNAGWNLRAIRHLGRAVVAVGIDINEGAVAEARTEELDARVMAINDLGQELQGFDLVCTSGVLIHIAPADLSTAMQQIVRASRRWVLAVEYEAADEEHVDYRGNAERLWKRPFGRLYEGMGLTLVAESEPQGFDRCKAWLLEKEDKCSAAAAA